MSRCFPYPPPGFEKNDRGDQHDSLAKEKHEEKKHKKEKRDKEKKEGKEKDKDRSKDKHREKKDRKEKHKDKKRGKDKDKDRNITSDDKRFDEHTDGHNEQKVAFSFSKSEEVKDSRFTEELGRRIRDEQEGAAKRMSGNITGQIQEGVDGLVPAFVQERGRANGKPIVANFISKEKHRADGVANIATASIQEKERANGKPNFISKEQHRADGFANISTATPLQKERGNGNPMVANFVSKEQRKDDIIEFAVRPLEKGNSNHQVLHRLSLEKHNDNHQVLHRLSVEKDNDNHQVLPRLSVEKGNGNHQVLPRLSVEKGNGNHQLSVEKANNNHKIVPRLSVEKGDDNHQVLPRLPVEEEGAKFFQGKEKPKARETDEGKGAKPRERDHEEKKNKGKDKNKDGEKEKEREKTDDGKGHRHRDRDPGKKSKGKEKNRNKKKEKEEKKRSKGENKHKGHDRPKDSEENDQPDSRDCKPLAPHTPKDSGESNQPDSRNSKPLAPQTNSEHSGGNDGHGKKRKNLETNGFLHEDAGQPNKVLKPAFSLPQPLENGKRLELDHLPSCPSTRHVTPNTVMEEKVINNKEHKVNGIRQAQPCPVDLRRLTANGGKSLAVSRPPHPDSQYLSQVYSVPKLEEWPESDDQAWLFSSSSPHPTSKAGESQQVWAQGMQIEMADVFALPYVIPY